MYIFLIVKTGSSLIHPHGFQLFVLLPWLIEINSFVCSNKINRLCKAKFFQNSNRCKRFLKLPNVLLLVK